MSRATLRTVLVAALVVLAGCAGSVPGGTTDADDSPAAGDGTAGTVNFYLSDQPNAIDDFEHLNVTVSKVGFHRVGDADDGDDANRTTTSATTTNATPVPNATTTESTTTTAANVTTTAGGDESGDGRWVTYDAPNVSVDLTRLVGANATRLAEFGVPEGEYDAVFVHVSSVEGTLDSGEEVRVKLPSEKLQLHSEFRVGANASVDFVYDIAVHKAGKSGKYILRPVVSESGTEVEIEDVDDDRDDREDDDRDGRDGDRGDGADRDGDDREQSSLDARFVGNVTPGGNATISVTRNGSAVANATVEVDGGSVVRTGADGTVTVAVPDDEEFEVEVEAGDDETELEVEFDGDDRGSPE